MISASLVLISHPSSIFPSVYETGEKPLEDLALRGLQAACCKPSIKTCFWGTCLPGSHPRSASREKVLNSHGPRPGVS